MERRRTVTARIPSRRVGRQLDHGWLPAMLCIMATATLALASAPAQAQAPDEDDPTIVAPRQAVQPSRPGVIPRGRPAGEQAAEAEGDEEGSDDESEGDDTEASADEGSAGDATGEPSGRSAPSRPTGPRVLNVEDLAPDVGEIDGHFEEAFDPLNPPRNVRVNVDFHDADLNDVVMWISALTGRNFIIADTISSSKKITIISPQPVTIGEAYRAFLAALNMNGLTIVPFGRFLKIVEASEAQQQPLEPTEEVGSIPRDDRMVTHILQLEHVSLQNIQPVIDALKTSNASIVTYEPTNTLIITETGTNLRRLLDIIDMLDVPSGQEQINIYQVQYSDAEELRNVLLEIFEQEQDDQASTRDRRRRRRRREPEEQQAPTAESVGEGVSAVSVSKIIADPRTNKLIIIANERSYERIVQIARQLDVPIPGEGQIHVIFLENANATDLASTLQSLTQSIEQQRDQERSRARRRRDEPPSADEGSQAALFTGDISITADEATNSLVVVASLRDFLALQGVIEELDRRRMQVYVEAVIMEVSISRQNEFGIALNSGALPSIGGEDIPVFGATRVGNLSSLFLDPSSLMGLAVGLRGPEIEGTADLFGIGLPSFGAILQAVQTDNNVNVLSTPHILTMDNEEAEIVVGENIPFISGISGGLGGGGLGNLGNLGDALGDEGGLDLGNLGSLGGLAGVVGGGFPAVSVQRQDVALTLRITPQINESNFVRLEIEEQVDDVQSIDPVLGPRTTTRQANTTVVVEDQQTVVIGGLMRDSVVEDVSKVPFLGDIPVIGYLFRNRTSRVQKTNLILLLTPYIIRDPSDFREIFRRKMDERNEFISFFGRRDLEYVQAIDYHRKDGPMQSMYETVQEAVQRNEQRLRAFTPTINERPVTPAANEPLRINVGDDGGGGEPPAEGGEGPQTDSRDAAPAEPVVPDTTAPSSPETDTE